MRHLCIKITISPVKRVRKLQSFLSSYNCIYDMLSLAWLWTLTEFCYIPILYFKHNTSVSYYLSIYLYGRSDEPTSSGFYARRLTFDHRAEDEGEQERITAAGGFVTRGRYVTNCVITPCNLTTHIRRIVIREIFHAFHRIMHATSHPFTLATLYVEY